MGKKWMIGVGLAVAALVVLYFAAASARHSPQLTWLFLAAFAALVASIFVLIGRGISHAGPPPEFVERPPLIERAEIAASGAQQNPWAGTARTLVIVGVGLIGILVYVGLYLGAAYFQIGWVIYLGLGLTAVLLILVAMLAAPREV